MMTERISTSLALKHLTTLSAPKFLTYALVPQPLNKQSLALERARDPGRDIQLEIGVYSSPRVFRG